jgi:hypothetical protein
MVVSPDMPLIEIDATAGSSDAAVAAAGAAAVVAEQAWRQHSGAADPRLRRVLPTAVSGRRSAPSPAVDGIVGALIAATAATAVAAVRRGWPALTAARLALPVPGPRRVEATPS